MKEWEVLEGAGDAKAREEGRRVGPDIWAS